jgi:HlyD family secretion protein
MLRSLMEGACMSRISIVLGLGLLLAACSPGSDDVLHGYVEGDYRLLGARDGGIVASLAVTEGERVAAGDLLFAMEDADARARVEQAQASLAAAQAQLDDLLAGGRVEERQQARQRLDQAVAARDLAQATFNRTRALADDSNASQQRLDADRAALRQAQAAVEEAQAALDLISAPGRENQIAAAEAQVRRAEAAVAEAQDALDHRRVAAPAEGTIERIYRFEGETATPGAPIVSMLPPGNIRIRFFIPEPRFGSVQMGDEVAVSCDGCAEGLTARISFIAPEAEFTPPEIFTIEERAKLVVMVEATPEAPDAFRPGQPVDVRLTP